MSTPEKPIFHLKMEKNNMARFCALAFFDRQTVLSRQRDILPWLKNLSYQVMDGMDRT